MREEIANPAALGLACFALTTFLLSMINAKLVPTDTIYPLTGCALIYGGLVQVAAGMLDMKAGSTFGGTAFSSYGGFWTTLGLVFLLDFMGVWEVSAVAIGAFLLVWTFFTFYMWLGTLRLNMALVVTFTTLLITFVLLTIGHLTGIPAFNIAGGYVGMFCALCAWYVSAAIVLEECYKKSVLPLGPISHARSQKSSI